MKYCNQCGSRVDDNDIYCSQCGCTVFLDVNNPQKKIKNKKTNQMNANNNAFDNASFQKINTNNVLETQNINKNSFKDNGENTKNNIDKKNDDNGNIGYFFLGLFLPIIGAVIYCIIRKDYPKNGKRTLIGTIVGFIIIALLLIMLFLLILFIPSLIIDYYI